jgi:hypothetical protein
LGEGRGEKQKSNTRDSNVVRLGAQMIFAIHSKSPEQLGKKRKDDLISSATTIGNTGKKAIEQWPGFPRRADLQFIPK